MDSCIFCKIAKGEIPSRKVYEDKETLAFLDINPVSKGHVLVIPKAHAADIFGMNEGDAKAVMATTRKISIAAMEGLGAAGINLLNSNKKAAGQEVMHYHMHVIPRYAGDGVKIFPGKSYNEGDFEETARKIKNAISLS